jgi:homoserine kinase
MPKKKTPASFRIALPATSANLGPAFDTAALALDLYIEVEAKPAKEFSIVAKGRDRDVCQRLENHLILNTYREVLKSAGKKITPLALAVNNDIPIGKGCGSSAAARLAGIALADHFGQLGWAESQIVGEASRREDHPDNASACWWGGLTIARMSAPAETQVVNVIPKGKWPLLLVVPADSLSTEKARGILPAQYSRADAVTNVRNSMFLVAAFTQGRPDLLGAALEDRIHQPYRAPYCPLLPSLQRLKGVDGILGAALNGAGPSVLVFLDPRVAAENSKKRVAGHLLSQKLSAELLLTSIVTRGAGASR